LKASSEHVTGKARGPIVFGTAWLLLSLLAGAWTLATPIGAAPDEPAHLIKAASVARGEFIGERDRNGALTVQVPQYIAFTHAQTCYAFDEDVTADCMPPVPGDSNQLVDAPTTAGLYNPLYYLLTGWPSLIASDASGIYGMRLASGVLVGFMLALSFALVATWRRPVLPVIGLLTAVTPMVLFLSGTVNPNGLEVAATLTAFVAVLSVVREPDVGSLPLRASVVFVAAAVAANMRGLSLLWLAVAILAPLILLPSAHIMDLARRRAVQFAAGGTLVAVVAAGVWLLSSNSLGNSISADEPVTNAPAVGTSPFIGFVWTMSLTFHYAQGMVGIFGWLDTPAPPFVYFTWAVLAGGLIVLAAILARGRAFAFAGTLLGAVVLLPPILQGIYITEGGVIWQGRYILPLFVCLVVAVAVVLADRFELHGTTLVRLLLVILPLWGVAQFQSFATALRRYAVGYSEGWIELLDPAWVPPGGIFPLLGAVAVVLLAASAGIFVLLRLNAAPMARLEQSLLDLD
jgi:hypothetical protein